MTTEAQRKATRLGTIHKDMAALSEAIRFASSDVETGRATIAATIETRLTDKLEDVAFRLERMVDAENIGVIGVKVYQAAMAISSAFIHQRHNCRRNRAQFIAHGAAMSALTESGVYQLLMAKRKEAKAEALTEAVEQVEVETVAVEASTTAPESVEPATHADPLTTSAESVSERVERLGEREAVDPETGHTYKITKEGYLMAMAKGSTSYYAMPFTVFLLGRVIDLGLLDGVFERCKKGVDIEGETL